MLIQIYSDNATSGSENLSQEVTARIEAALSRFSQQITRIEVHLSKIGHEQHRCVIEARLEGLQPFAVSSEDDKFSVAIDDSLTKMESRIESTLGRLRHPAH